LHAYRPSQAAIPPGTPLPAWRGPCGVFARQTFHQVSRFGHARRNTFDRDGRLAGHPRRSGPPSRLNRLSSAQLLLLRKSPTVGIVNPSASRNASLAERGKSVDRGFSAKNIIRSQESKSSIKESRFRSDIYYSRPSYSAAGYQLDAFRIVPDSSRRAADAVDSPSRNSAGINLSRIASPSSEVFALGPEGRAAVCDAWQQGSCGLRSRGLAKSHCFERMIRHGS